jgi:hypothetical protein
MTNIEFRNRYRVRDGENHSGIEQKSPEGRAVFGRDPARRDWAPDPIRTLRLKLYHEKILERVLVDHDARLCCTPTILRAFFESSN